MLSSSVSSAISGISANLAKFQQAAGKISDPDRVADVSDIVAMKQAETGTKASVAVLKKAIESTRLIDEIA